MLAAHPSMVVLAAARRRNPAPNQQEGPLYTEGREEQAVQRVQELRGVRQPVVAEARTLVRILALVRAVKCLLKGSCNGALCSN